MNARDFRMALAGLKLSQRKLALALGVSPQTVTSWVNANELPPVVRLFIWIARNHDLETAKEAVKT